MLVNYKKLNMLAVGAIRFQPGIAEYPTLTSADFDKMQKEYPTVKRLVDDGDLELLDTDFSGGQSDFDQGQGGQSATQSLAGMKDKQAIDIVKQTGDINLLNTWLQAKPSQNVDRAIRDQLKAIEKAGEKKEG